MLKTYMLSGLLSVAITMSASELPSWYPVASIPLTERLVEPNIGGRAALCSWVVEKENYGQTTVLVGVKNNDDSYGIKKLVYNLDKGEPQIASTAIHLRGFIPRTILRTHSGILYLTASKSIDNDWLKLVSGTSLNKAPESLQGGVWVSVDDGDSWIELKTNDSKGIMNAGYMACYQTDVKDVIDATAVRVGGAGISSTEIVCFTSLDEANKYLSNINNKLAQAYNNSYGTVFSRIQSDSSANYHFVIATAIDTATGKSREETRDSLVTRIGELPIDSNGIDLKYNIIDFRYRLMVVYSEHKNSKWGGHHYITGRITALGTPIFGDYTSQLRANKINSYKQIDTYQANDGESFRYGDSFSTPKGYYRYTDNNNNNKPEINDKYRHCIVTYDNTGLILTKRTKNDSDLVNIYHGPVKVISKNYSNPIVVANPQEVVAQYDGFMAVTETKSNNSVIHIKPPSKDGQVSNFITTNVFADSDKDNIKRVMITGVNPLDWHSNKEARARYNGKLLAIGQSYSTKSNEALLKLYTQPTLPVIRYVRLGDFDAIKYSITGEPYAKVRYWWHRVDSNSDFVPLTLNDIQNNNKLHIVDKGEVRLDENGNYLETTYLPIQSGTYRLIASAVVGGFYCDHDTNGSIGIAAGNPVNIQSNVPEPPLEWSLANPKYKYVYIQGAHVHEKTEYYDYDDKKDIVVNPEESLYFKINVGSNYPNNSKLTWYLDDKEIKTHTQEIRGKHEIVALIRLVNSSSSKQDQIVTVKLTNPDNNMPLIKHFKVIVNPKITVPIITADSAFMDDQNLLGKNIIRSCADRIIELSTVTGDNDATWYETQTMPPSKNDWEKIPLVDNYATSSVLPILQLTSGPALNDNPRFFIGTKHWIVGDWKAINVDKEKDNSCGIATALHGTTKQTLLSEKFILIDARSSYLYIAAAKTAEVNIKLILTLQCYGNNQKKLLGTVSLPEAALTNAWSSYGDVINNDNNYLFPKGTVFVKLAISLPQSTLGTDISAIRLIEIPKDTLSTIDAYITRFSKWKDGLWGFAKQWDHLVGCDSNKGMAKHYYKVETKGNNQTAVSNVFRSEVRQKIFFTNYQASDEDNNPILLQLDPKSAELIVVNVNVAKGEDTYTTLSLDIAPSLGNRMALSWETTKNYNSNPVENEWVAKSLNFYNNQHKVELLAQDEPTFTRCRAEIKDSENPCNGLVAYSQIFKVVPKIVKAKKDEN